jgi:hypothetical protein
MPCQPAEHVDDLMLRGIGAEHARVLDLDRLLRRTVRRLAGRPEQARSPTRSPRFGDPPSPANSSSPGLMLLVRVAAAMDDAEQRAGPSRPTSEGLDKRIPADWRIAARRLR